MSTGKIYIKDNNGSVSELQITATPASHNVNVTSTGSGNAVTEIAQNGHGITVTKNLTFSTNGHTHSQYLTAHQSLANYATTGHTHSQYLTAHQSIPNLSISTTGTGNAISDITVSGHAITLTKTTISGGGIDSIPSITIATSGSGSAVVGLSVNSTNGHAITATLGGNFETVGHTHSQYLTAHQSLANYATTGHTHSQYLTSQTQLSISTATNGGNAVTAISVSNHAITITKGSSFETVGHTHSQYLTAQTQLSISTATNGGNAVTAISVSNHAITITKGSTFLTSQTQLSISTATNGGNAVTAVSVSNHAITITKGSTFSLSNHNHDTVYSGTGHTHANYSLTSHNHNTLYSGTGHTHANYSVTNHTHANYSVTNHTHAAYLGTGSTAVNATKWNSHPFGWGTGAKTAGSTDTANASMIYFQYVN